MKICQLVQSQMHFVELSKYVYIKDSWEFAIVFSLGIDIQSIQINMHPARAMLC